MTATKTSPSTELARIERVVGTPEVYNQERIQLIARTVAQGSTPDELALFITFAQRKGLSPLDRQVYFLKDRTGRVSFVTGIDGLRLIAQRTGEYQGQVGPEWKADRDAPWSDVPPEGGPPYACRVGVLRKGFTQPLWRIVTYKSFYRDTPNWKNAPDHQLAIRAESHALRAAFPAETSGLSVTYNEDGERSVVIVNPDAKATNEQLAVLHIWADAKGLSREQRHALAADVLGEPIETFAALTKGQAGELITAWNIFPEDDEAPDAEPEKSAAGSHTGGSTAESGPGDPSLAGSAAADAETGLPNPVAYTSGPHAGKTMRQLAEKKPALLLEIVNTASGIRKARAEAWFEWAEQRKRGPKNSGDVTEGSATQPDAGGEEDGSASTPEVASSDPSEGEVVDEGIAPHSFKGALGAVACEDCGYAFEFAAHRVEAEQTELVPNAGGKKRRPMEGH